MKAKHKFAPKIAYQLIVHVRFTQTARVSLMSQWRREVRHAVITWFPKAVRLPLPPIGTQRPGGKRYPAKLKLNLISRNPAGSNLSDVILFFKKCFLLLCSPQLRWIIVNYIHYCDQRDENLRVDNYWKRYALHRETRVTAIEKDRNTKNTGWSFDLKNYSH